MAQKYWALTVVEIEAPVPVVVIEPSVAVIVTSPLASLAEQLPMGDAQGHWKGSVLPRSSVTIPLPGNGVFVR